MLFRVQVIRFKYLIIREKNILDPTFIWINSILKWNKWKCEFKFYIYKR